MKNLKKALTLAVAALLIFSMSIFSVAAINDGKITVANAVIGETYTISKIFDAKLGDDGAITYEYAGTLPENDYFVQDANGFVSATENAVDENGELTVGAIEFLGTLNKTQVDSQVAVSGTVEFAELEYGYYYVTSSLGAVVTIDSTKPEAIVIDKNGAPSITKTVNKEDATIGEALTFTIEVPLVQYNGDEKIYEYYVFDDMENCMTYNNDLTATIKIGDGEAVPFTAYKEYPKDLAEGETFVLAEGQDFLVVIPMQGTSEVEGETLYNGEFLYDANAVITFTYTATFNENIEVGTDMLNYVELNWASSDTPDNPPVPPAELPSEPNGEGPNSVTKDYSSEIAITKINGDADILKGAKFSISGVSTGVHFINKTIFVKDDAGEYWMLKNGMYTTEAPVTEEYSDESTTYLPNAYLYDSVTQKYTRIHSVTKDTTDIQNITAEGYVDENGVITFTGLGVGTYTITEIVAPDGYNLLTAPVVVDVKFDDVNKVFTATVDNEEAIVVDGVIAFDVVNNAGTVLPGTGGIGTTIFYVVGGILLVAAAVLLITKKFAGANK